MTDDKTIETIHNVLTDFTREFENNIQEIYKPYRFAKDDVLPAWRAAFCRQEKAEGLRKACIAYFARFMKATLPSVEGFCPTAKDFFVSNAEKIDILFAEQLEDVVRRRSSMDDKIILGCSSMLKVRLRKIAVGACLWRLYVDSVIIGAVRESMRNISRMVCELAV